MATFIRQWTHATPTLGDVEVEEVAVEDGLHAPGHDRDDVVEGLSVVPGDKHGYFIYMVGHLRLMSITFSLKS